MKIQFVKASQKYVSSFRHAVGDVARERKYLASTTAFPEEESIAFVREIEQKNLSQYYALDGDVVVGWCDILPKKFEGLNHVGVLGIGVLAPYRGKGIGKKLLNLAMRHAKEINNLEKVELEVFKSNKIAIKMYEQAGFVKEGERIDSRKMDGKYDNIVLMGKKL